MNQGGAASVGPRHQGDPIARVTVVYQIQAPRTGQLFRCVSRREMGLGSIAKQETPGKGITKHRRSETPKRNDKVNQKRW
jgi:hypothetical protein